MRSRNFTAHVTSLVALGLVMATSARAQQPVQWPHGKKAAIVLTYDDSLHSQLEIAIPQLNEVGFKGTFFLNGTFPPEDVSRWRAVCGCGARTRKSFGISSLPGGGVSIGAAISYREPQHCRDAA